MGGLREIRRIGKYRVRRGGWARRGAVGEGGGTWRVGSCRGVRCGQERSREIVERGEDERHLHRREYGGRQTDVHDGESLASRVTANNPQGGGGYSQVRSDLPTSTVRENY